MTCAVKLVVVREGTSMILEGIGKSKCDNCFALLRPALECADQLNKLIGELLVPLGLSDYWHRARPQKKEERTWKSAEKGTFGK